MFYLVTPNETSFSTTDDVPLIVDEVFALESIL